MKYELWITDKDGNLDLYKIYGSRVKAGENARIMQCHPGVVKTEIKEVDNDK